MANTTNAPDLQALALERLRAIREGEHQSEHPRNTTTPSGVRGDLSLGGRTGEHPGRCPRCAAFIREARDPRADSLCRSCPAWEPTFRAVVPPEVLEARRAGKREYARLVAAGVAPEVAATEADRVAEALLEERQRGAGE